MSHPTLHTSTLGSRDTWQRRISRSGSRTVVEVRSPYGVPVFLTPRQHMVLIWVGRGRKMHQREMPAVIGYSLMGFNGAIKQLQKLGLVGHVTRRGCRGFTRLWSNVRPTSSGSPPFRRFHLPRREPGPYIPPVRVEEPPKPRLGRLVVVDGKWVAA